MPFFNYLAAALISLWCGLDRTAAGQFMVCRPIVAAPLTGWLLGDVVVGLQIGSLLELFWLGRLPIGASIPPDDTQVAIGSTVLALVVLANSGLQGESVVILSLLVGLPLGKSGEIFDRLARLWNARLLTRAEFLLDAGQHQKVERLHLLGLLHFGIASLATFAVIVGGGIFCIQLALDFLPEHFDDMAGWFWLTFPLIGIAATLGTLKARRSVLLFSCSFAFALLVF